jgi:RNA-directed DNA polymerase
VKDPKLVVEDTRPMKDQGTVKKIHSLIDKVYHPTNLRKAWETVRANNGSGGIDKVSVSDFDQLSNEELDRLNQQLKEDSYQPIPVRRVNIPKRNKPNEKRPLGIPAVRDRVCQQALKNRLEPIFEPCFSDCSFGYRTGRSTHQAMRKIYREILNGNEWVLDADLKDFFGNVHHERLIDMIAEKVSDGRVLRLIRQMLQAGYMEKGKKYSTHQGTPQGGLCKALHKGAR